MARLSRYVAPLSSLVVAACVIAACDDEARSVDDDDGSTGAGANGATNGPGGGGVGGSTTAAGGSGTGTSSGGSDPIPTCLATCTTPADCELGGPPWDADNYACVSGGCIYLGCNSDAECQSQGDYVCRNNLGLDTCVFACSTPADCDYGSGPAWDADNYACVSGGCIYQGCNSDVECQSQGDYLCRDAGAGVSFCFQACAVAADCDLGAGPAWDADNFACEAGACFYTGCTSTSECMSQGDYVCGAP